MDSGNPLTVEKTETFSFTFSEKKKNSPKTTHAEAMTKNHSKIVKIHFNRCNLPVYFKPTLSNRGKYRTSTRRRGSRIAALAPSAAARLVAIANASAADCAAAKGGVMGCAVTTAIAIAPAAALLRRLWKRRTNDPSYCVVKLRKHPSAAAGPRKLRGEN